MRRVLVVTILILIGICGPGATAQAPVAGGPPPTDLDRFMALALQRRDVDRQALGDYVLDEVESFEVLGPGRVPVARKRREYTWYVRDGMHVRSPLVFDGVPIAEAERRAYEARWIRSEAGRRTFRTERDAKRAAAGNAPALSAPSINEPRFIAESYFMDFTFEPGNYYLAGKETLDGHEVLKIDYLPTRLFHDEDHGRGPHSVDGHAAPEAADHRTAAKRRQDDQPDDAFDRKMNKTAQVTLWVDPASHQIVKYTFDNAWLDFLPAGWLVKIDDLRASMQMGQPFAGVWLPRTVSLHAGISLALGPAELSYTRAFSNYRKADVSSKITVPK